MKLQYLLCAVLCSVFSTFGQSPISLSVHFENNALRPNRLELAKLDSLLKSLPEDTLVKAELKAYCDAPGGSAYNRELGNMRLHFVRRQLQAYLADSLIIAENYADAGLKDSARNDVIRRVDLLLYLKPKPDYGPELATLLAALKPEAQVFEIDPQKDTALLCKGGTIIYVPAKSFKAVRRKQTIRFEVREARHKSEMILEALTTTSNNQILASDGMIKIEVFQGRRKLKLAKGKTLGISMPQLTKLEKPQLFDGVYKQANILNWLPSRNSFFGFSRGFSCNTGYYYAHCPFFWCKIRGVFRGRPRARTYVSFPFYPYYEEYGVETYEELIALLNADLPEGEKLSTDDEILAKIYSDRRAKIEERMASGSAYQSDLSDYLFNTGRLGWINIDSFSSYPPEMLLTQRIKCKQAERVQMQIVFKEQNSILPPNFYNQDSFLFKDVPKDEPVIAVAIKFIRGQAYLAMSEFKLGEEPELNFEPVTAESIKESLKVLDA